MLRPRSIRFTVLIVILITALSPLGFVLLSYFYNNIRTKDIIHDVTQAANLLAQGESNAETPGNSRTISHEMLDRIAKKYKVRLRLIDRQGRTLDEVDHHLGAGIRPALYELSGYAYGPNGLPNMILFDYGEGPMDRRKEFVEAMTTGFSSGCRISDDKRIEVCHALRAVEISDQGSLIIYAQASTHRAIRLLYDLKFALLQLTLYSIVVALILALWISRRIVRPIEKLKGQILAKASFANRQGDIALKEKNEFGLLADTFNTLLLALDALAKTNEVFLSDLAHEFKNPVAAIKTAADNIRASSAIDRPKQERLYTILSESAAKLDHLVSEFLEIARAEAGLPGEEREASDCIPLLFNLAKSFKESGLYPGIAITVECNEKASLVVRGVARKLGIAFKNIIDNALSFTPANGAVTIKAEKDEGFAVISVSDQGPGIHEDDIPKIFDRFFTTRKEIKGTGLGLALTRAIIEAHQGAIRVESNLGHGATFIVKLPLFIGQ
jgi:signal transduction histidine kinase